ncbi:MAG: peptidoglycan-binding protein [Beijerinckiaceae bacterium]
MDIFRVAAPPAKLFSEPDAALAPKGSVDSNATVAIELELAQWARVKRTDPEGNGATGWMLRADLVRIDPSVFIDLTLFSEPLGADGRAVKGRIVSTTIKLADWAKVVVQTDKGEPDAGWIKAATPAPAPPPPAAVLDDALVLGPNEKYRAALLEAARKSRIDAAALCALIDAEASRISDGPEKGCWNPAATNPGSGAAGLTQFLASTWIGHARLAGTALRLRAEADGIVDAAGKVTPGREPALLELRLDPTLSIMAAAEYADINLKGLISRGLINATLPDDQKAWHMYLAHHEGLAGAAGFLSGSRTYSLDILALQVGAARAQQLAAQQGGDANKAYRAWLNQYISDKIRPSKFRKSGAAVIAAVALAATTSGSGHPEEVHAYSSLDDEACTQIMTYSGPSLSFAEVGGNPRLAVAVQKALSVHGYLDPPADGAFAAVSQWALAEFCRRCGLKPADGVTHALRTRLVDPAAGLPAARARGSWIDAVIKHLAADGSFICRHPDCWNIVYIEGMDASGALNSDIPNQFNDARVLFALDDNGVPQFKAWEATTEPGEFYTLNPMSSEGAARIAFRQFKSWAVGQHLAEKTTGHEALVQVKPVTVHRDFNKDFKRTGDRLDRGIFGVNQHAGYDAPATDIKNTSAGCLVGRLKQGHRDFMTLVKQDARYKVNKAYNFVTAIIPGDRLPL